ncbi:MAG: c-type cytochrome [Chloroflexi bacterium]|nr:c-type cytochrome [Chloroflexota bacterium]
MKLRLPILILLLAMALTACNFSLSEDITPPPNYVSPTPMPTLGALYPSTAPDPQNGALIYSQYCAACHGNKGLGDGPQSMQLPVTVPGIGLADVAQSASPAQWYEIVSEGNLDRFMPPFIGALSDQERWDVVAYVMTLHTTPDQIAQGKSLFDANCAGCAGKFSDLQQMAKLSEADLVGIIKNGNSNIPAFGKNFTDAQAFDVAAYIRTLTFVVAAQPTATEVAASVSTATPAPASGTQEAGAATAETPSAANQTPGTPAAATSAQGTPAATNIAGTGTVSGTIQMASGGNVPANLAVTLHGYDHGQDTSGTTSPQEVLTLNATSASDGTFRFDNVAMPTNRIFMAEVSYGGIKYQSTFGTVTAGTTNLTLTPVKLYESTTDFNTLKFDQIHFYTDFSTQGTVQVLEIYAFTNSTNKAVIISTDGSTIPFIKLPDGAQNTGYQADQSQNSAQFVAADQGVAAIPSDKPYSIIAFFNLPYNNQVEIKQPFVINAASAVLLIPDGMKVSGPQLTNLGVQSIQNVNYQELQASNLNAGDTLDFTVSGQPPSAASAAATTTTTDTTTQGLLVGAGALGIVLIAIGGFLFIRDRRRADEDEDEEEPEFESSDEVLDAIIALDDLHRAGKIADEAYNQRRNELKELLKGKM